jgi:hypothetical protein
MARKPDRRWRKSADEIESGAVDVGLAETTWRPIWIG